MPTHIIETWYPLAATLFVKSCCFLGVIWVVLLAARRASAAVKHAILAVSLACVLLLPLYTPALPQWHIDTPTAAIAPQAPAPAVTQSTSPTTAATLSTSHSTVDHAQQPSTTPVVEVGVPSIPQAPKLPKSPFDVRPLLFSVWLAGVCLLGLRMAGSHRKLRQAIDRATPFTVDHSSTGLSTSTQVFVTGDIAVPLTAGWRKPVILLPVDAIDWPASRLLTVLAHEAAHIRRGDWPLDIIARLGCCLFWPQPLVWLTARRMRLEAELACDDIVVLGGIGATSYATDLLEVAKGCARREAPAAGLAMANRSTLEVRLREIVNPTRRRKGLRRRAAAAIAGALCAGFLPVAAITLSRAKIDASSTAVIVAAPGPTPSVTLPNGVTVQLQGLNSDEYGTLGNYWWDADGNTIVSPQQSGDRFHNRSGFEFNQRNQPRLLSFKLTSPNGLNCSTSGELMGITGMVGGTGFVGTDVRLDDAVLRASVPSFGHVYIGFQKPQRTFDYRLGVAAGPWKTVLSIAPPLHPTPASVQETPEPGGSVNGGIWLFLQDKPNLGYKAKTGADHNVDLLPNGGTFGNEARRVTLLDKFGCSLPIHQIDGIEDCNPFYAIPAADFAKVVRIVIQTRPYQWAEFRNIAVDRVPTASAPADPPQIATPKPLPAYTKDIDGVLMSLVAVASPKSEGNRWWLPDGTPLAGPIKADKTLGVPPDQGGKSRALVFGFEFERSVDFSYSERIVDEHGAVLEQFPNEDQQLSPQRHTTTTYGPHGIVLRRYVRRDRVGVGGFGMYVHFPANDSRCRAEILASTSIWANLAQLPFRPSEIRHHVVTGQKDYFMPDVSLYVDRTPSMDYTDRTGKWVEIPFLKNGQSIDASHAVRIVAIMRNGQTVPMSSGMSDRRGRFATLAFDPKSYINYYNRDATPSDIVAFELQSRPMRRFVIDNIAVDPSK